ncbi:hypothetical protein L0664_08330 [Octadecabacter sp. G9-8]|uniref:Uncharacterized protein n=1 Tax=Octadecabacter dasysiphoniae TaxID=2909341 RepID=A0ABS9CUX6_9RHOB|nr:hypothetical protein [Octadecabacter dasysiphoniae]MCF2871071.1 hypothetical protein [Octadecabacter dasysiphoniae]
MRGLVRRTPLGFDPAMVKHLAFWIGFFAAALLIIPVAVGIWGAADEFARNVAVFLFGAISVLIVVLVIVLFFRDRLLRRVLGTAETSLDDVLSSLVKGVSAAAHGDRATAETEAQAFAKSATGWYVWSGFYRWVIASALGLLLAFGAFTGTVLLFEQNRKLTEQTVLMGQQGELMKAQTERMQEQSTQFEMQNEIMTISLVSELRGQLESSVNQISERTIQDDNTDETARSVWHIRDGEGCGASLSDDVQLKRPPSRSVIAAITNLGSSKQISAQVVQALKFLLLDDDDAVAYGALIILDRLKVLSNEDLRGRSFRNMHLDNEVLLGAYAIELVASKIGSFECEDCNLTISDSLVDYARAETLSIRTSLLSGDMSEIEPEPILSILLDGGENQEDNAAEIFFGALGDSEGSLPITLTSTNPWNVCRDLLALAEENIFLQFFE